MSDPLREVLETYQRVPDTPPRASEADVALAQDALSRGIDPPNLAHAIRVATLRRHLRDSAAGPLAPVRSLAYYLRTLEGLGQEALHPDYIDYVNDRFELLLRQDTLQTTKPRPHDQNPAVLRDR